MYAVIDVEATGGKSGEESIIEIAIFLYDGEKVIDQVISLVQPDREIDAYVQKLTRITPHMVSTAPKFHEVAKRIIEITDGAILVGHNIGFDYRMLKQEFRKLGYTYYRETIDTLSLSEKHFPDAESYSLGKLSRALGIPVSDRHRASGDARATLGLFQILQDKDSGKDIITKENALTGTKPNAFKFDSLLKGLPNEIGILYVLNQDNRVIYLSKSENIAQSARKLLTGKSNLSNKIKLSVSKITYESTGNELISWLKENHEIKTLKPILNENKKKLHFPFSIYVEESKGFKQLSIDHTHSIQKHSVLKMSSYNNALRFLSLISEEYELCSKINGIYRGKGSCLGYAVGECHGACVGKESAESYNHRVDSFLNKICLVNKSILIIGKGRSLSEKSFIWVKNTACKGYGFFDLNHQIKTEKLVRNRMVPVEENEDLDSIVRGFLFTEKYVDIHYLNSQ